MRRIHSRSARACSSLILLLATLSSLASAGMQGLDLIHQRLELPAIPADLISTDLNGDGRPDLLIVLAYSERTSISEDRFEDMMQITTVIPAILSRRELRAYVAGADGALEHAATLELLPSVVSIAAGIEGVAAVALTDSGVDVLEYFADRDPALRFQPWIEEPTIFSGSGSYLAQLKWVQDLNGDGRLDLLFPAASGPAVFLAQENGRATTPTQRLRFTEDKTRYHGDVRRDYPWPTVRDLNGDDLPDLFVSDDRVEVLFGQGDGTFAPIYNHGDCAEDHGILKQARADGPPSAVGSLSYLGDLDGDGKAEAVVVEELSRDGGLRAGLKDTKRPRQQFRIYHLDDHGLLELAPYQEMIVEGHTFGGEDDRAPFQQFQDLDGDGRMDLITVTLDFSMFQIIKVMTTKRIGIALDFHIWRQDDAGRFREVPNLDLSEKLKFNLNNFRVTKFAQFAGDFDGDGRVDFVHLGRGRSVTIHSGAQGCLYPTAPDLKLSLEEPLQDIGLIEIDDFNGDSRADLVAIRLLPSDDQGISAAALVDLYLSGGSR